MPVDAAHEGITQLLRAEAEASEVVKTAKDGAPPPLAESPHRRRARALTHTPFANSQRRRRG